MNPALIEPFGLTLIEASACGLPIVSTNEGGPVDIIKNCENGITVDATKPKKIAAAVHSLLVDQENWNTCSNNGINGVRQHYSWHGHCVGYLQYIHELLPGARQKKVKNMHVPTKNTKRPSFGKRLTNVNKLLITDIDNTLAGDNSSMRQLFRLLEEHQGEIAWGVATGRSLELTLEAMTEYDFPMPDILVCSVGTEIYYGPDLRTDKGWQKQISFQWNPEKIKEALSELDFLVFQEAEGQREFKVSYYLEEKDNRLDMVHHVIAEQRQRCKIIYSHGQFLDILPIRASKGKAIDYIRYKYEFSPRYVMVAGDSGNDEDMISGKARGLVVANHSEELKKLNGKANIYFSSSEYAAGIIDGLYHYGLLQQ